jgi:hypothetical protein
MFKHLAMGALCAGLIACGGTSEPTPEGQKPAPASAVENREVVSVGAMLANAPGGKLVVDLRNSDLGFRFEQGLDHSAITIICPSSREMNLEKWLPELAAEVQTTPAQLQKGFTMYPFMAPAPGTVTAQYIPACGSNSDGSACQAEKEKDGSWACVCY